MPNTKVKIKRTTALHLAAKGLGERANCSFTDMLKPAGLTDKAEWKNVSNLTLAYSSSHYRILGDYQFYMLLGKDWDR